MGYIYIYMYIFIITHEYVKVYVGILKDSEVVLGSTYRRT